jgi:hypothetical protein
MDSGHVALSFALAETITQRMASLSAQTPIRDLLKEAETEDDGE